MRALALLAAATLLTACGGGPDSPSAASPPADASVPARETGAQVVSTAREDTEVDLGVCLALARTALSPTPERCPAFLVDVIAPAVSACADAGGTLVPFGAGRLASLDVDADGENELLFDLTQHYGCNGAPSLFSCGSLGCPVGLYGERAGQWVLLGQLSPEDAPGAEVLAPAPGARYGDIRGGCLGSRPCREWTYYSWKGASYEASMIDADGHWVDVAPNGLWKLKRETAVLGAPQAGAAVLDRYKAETLVVVIGEARGAGNYLYISPCNACRSGFVEVGALEK